MKMFPLYFLSTLCMLFTQACEKLNLCNDKALGFPRVENLSDTLKLDGYYYGDLSEVNPNNPNIYILNRNGVFLNRNSFDLNDAKSGNVNLEVGDLQKQYKGSWGVYKLDGSQIEIQSWTSMSNGCVSVFTEKGIILNDSTFKITAWESSREDKIHYVDAKFKFVPFSPKPDSTVSFIP